MSFREKQLSDVVIKYTSKKARVDLDPTLLSSPELWRRVINDNFAHRKYVLLYEVRSRSQKINRELKAKAKRFAKLLGMELVDLSSYTYNVDDFVSAFKYAQVIITSSFHGTAFSVVFEKPFYSYKLGDSVDGRYVELLEKLKLEDVLVEYDYEPKCIPQIDYVKVNRLRDEMKWYSLKYLRNL